MTITFNDEETEHFLMSEVINKKEIDFDLKLKQPGASNHVSNQLKYTSSTNPIIEDTDIKLSVQIQDITENYFTNFPFNNCSAMRKSYSLSLLEDFINERQMKFGSNLRSDFELGISMQCNKSTQTDKTRTVGLLSNSFKSFMKLLNRFVKFFSRGNFTQ